MTKAERTIGTPDFDEAERAGKAEGGSSGQETAAGASADAGAAGDVDSSEAGASRAGASEAGASGAGASEEERPAAGGGRRRIAVLLAVAAFAYALDLVSKIIVVAELEGHPPIQLIGHYLQFEAVRNAGAAFGIGEAFTVVFGFIALTVIVVIARIARNLYSVPWAVALGLLLGGALGNLTDRVFRSPGVFRGHVVDFISPTHFAVFNLADSAIVCGGILIVLLSFRGSAPDGTVHKD